MSERLSISEPQREELWSLAGKLHDGILTAAERDRLESLIVQDDDAAAFCASYADVHAMLRWRFRPVKPDASESSQENVPRGVLGCRRPSARCYRSRIRAARIRRQYRLGLAGSLFGSDRHLRARTCHWRSRARFPFDGAQRSIAVDCQR